MPSIASVNALTAWQQRVNDELKQEHIHLEIGGHYRMDDMRVVCRCQGLAVPLNSMEHQSPRLYDMLSQNTSFLLAGEEFSPGIHDINAHAEIVTAGITLINTARDDPLRARMQQLRTEISLETALARIETLDYREEELGKFFKELRSARPKAIFLDLEGSKGSAIGISFIRSAADITNSGYNMPFRGIAPIRKMLSENMGNPHFKIIVTWTGATGSGSCWNQHIGEFKSILVDDNIPIYYMDDEPHSDLDRLASVIGSSREEIIYNLDDWNLRDITGYYDKKYTPRPGYHPGLTALLGWHGLLCHKSRDEDYSRWEDDLGDLAPDMSGYLRVDVVVLAVIGAFAWKCGFTWTPRDDRVGVSIVGCQCGFCRVAPRIAPVLELNFRRPFFFLDGRRLFRLVRSFKKTK